MFINLSGVSNTEGKVVETAMEPELTEVKNRMGTFSVVEKKPVRWKLSNTGRDHVCVEAEGFICLMIPCDRCLDDVTVKIPVHFTQELNLAQSAEDRQEALDEADYLEGYQIDAEKLLYHEILMNWPAKILCKPDCKGICRKCGQNLNEGMCDCDQQEYDPRMAAIKDIFNGTVKEV